VQEVFGAPQNLNHSPPSGCPGLQSKRLYIALDGSEPGLRSIRTCMKTSVAVSRVKKKLMRLHNTLATRCHHTLVPGLRAPTKHHRTTLLLRADPQRQTLASGNIVRRVGIPTRITRPLPTKDLPLRPVSDASSHRSSRFAPAW